LGNDSFREDIVATTIMSNCTCGKDNPERATLAFIVGNVAASADQPAIVLLTIEGVWVATKGYAEGIHKEGFQPLKEIIDSFVANGGQIWACGACTKPRGITEAQLIPGAKIVTAAMVVEAMAKGASTLDF
jgi:predicted peroxiredoxin